MHQHSIVKRSSTKRLEKDLFYCSISACILSFVSAALHPSLTGFAILNLVIFGSIVIIWSDKLFFLIDIIYRISRRRKFMHFVYTIGGSFSFLDALCTPANAQFFEKAEGFVKDNFVSQNAAGIDTAVSLVFNLLRALLLIYLGIALISILISMRNNEDWVSAAKLPFMVLIVVTLGDTLSQVIIGENGGSGKVQEI